jgi:hypothetical protein
LQHARRPGMERQLLDALYSLIDDLRDADPPKIRFGDRWIVLTYLWSVACDRPVNWACEKAHWPPGFLVDRPPSPATMSRRLRTPSVLRLLVRMLFYLQAVKPVSDRHFIDARPLCIGGSGGDRDARIGWGAGRMAKGYKLHAMVQSTGRLEALAIVPMNRNDTSMGPALLAHLPEGQGYVAGDTAYDADALYQQAATCGLQLVATPRVGMSLGHQRHSSRRLIGLTIARTPWGRKLLRERFGIDRCFGTWGNVPGGLWGLPPFVRHLDRVRRWVVGKLILVSLRDAIKNKRLRE